jgi:hypothetical protein
MLHMSYGEDILILQNKILRLMVGANHRHLCSDLLKEIREFTCPMCIHSTINELHFK